MLKKKKNGYMTAIFDSHKNKNDAKSIYRSTKELLGIKNAGQPSCLLVDGTLIKKPKMIANALQSFFKEKIQKIVSNFKKDGRDPVEILKNAMASWLGRINLPEFQISEISLLETRELIRGLGSSKSYGRDKIDAFSLKIGIDYLAPLICDMINISVRKQTLHCKMETS